MYKATVIISIYRDVDALKLILQALETQTESNFEIIVSEDGESEAVASYIDPITSENRFQHITQQDIGFRKNRALNRAILAARSDILIFIDGDCIPHPGFIEAHLRSTSLGFASTGRRVELGPGISQKIRNKQLSPRTLNHFFGYLCQINAMHRDRVKNYESGLYLPFLQRLTIHRHIRILGCNFSAHRRDLELINGFNEDFQAAGTGEDSDIDWRLRRAGVMINNVKFSAIQYHLHHPKNYSTSGDNLAIMEKTQEADKYICTNGLRQHDSPDDVD